MLWHSIFYGMAGANKVINNGGTSTDGVEVINKQIGGGSVFADMLEEKQTQQVKETVDASYRIYKEAKNYDVSDIKVTVDKDGELTFDTSKRLRKKTKLDFMKHPPVFNKEDLPIRVIQDNKKIHKKSNLICGYNVVFDPELLPKGLTDYDTTINIERDGITPRFFIEKYINKVVVRSNNNNNRAYLDLYFPLYASQFGKVDAILVSNLHKIMEDKNFRSDLLDFVSIDWVSDKAWNSDDICLFKYNDINPVDINTFDGSFVITFDCNIVNDGTDLTEKYRTKELDDKYAVEAPKREDIDVFTLARKIDRDNEKKDKNIDLNNLETTKLKL